MYLTTGAYSITIRSGLRGGCAGCTCTFVTASVTSAPSIGRHDCERLILRVVHSIAKSRSLGLVIMRPCYLFLRGNKFTQQYDRSYAELCRREGPAATFGVLPCEKRSQNLNAGHIFSFLGISKAFPRVKVFHMVSHKRGIFRCIPFPES